MRLRKHHIRVGRLALLLPFVLVLRPAANAQEKPTERMDVEIGVRALAGDRTSAQFDEYRDLHPGVYVRGFQAGLDHLFGRNLFLTLQTRDSLRADQAFRATFGDTGKFRFEFDWQGTPHDFTSRAVSLFTQSAPGVFTVPSAARIGLANNAAALPLTLAGASPFDVALKRRLGSGSFAYTPTAGWTFQLGYSHGTENGYRPFGAMLNGFVNMLEVPEPTDYRVHEATAGVEYGGARGAFQADYTASIFNNEVSTLVFDNPFRDSDAIGGSSRGRMALYPDNTAQSASFAGALNLSGTTRLMGFISPQWMRQNSPFLPYTINSLAGVPDLPAASLNAIKTRLAMNYTLASHPLPNFSVAVHYRDYNYSNDTPSLLFPGYVQADASITQLARQSLPYSYARQNVGIDATWLMHKGDALIFGYDFEDLDRTHRDVAKTQEHTGSVKLDLNPKKWILFRGSFAHAERNPKAYIFNDELNPKGDEPGYVALPAGWRMYDEAARRRNKGSALLEIDPSDRLSLTASYDTLQDRFEDSVYGLLGARSVDSALDASYILRPNITVFGNYAYERYKSDQRSREYEGPLGSASRNNTPNNDWESYIRDGVHTFGGGVSISGFRRKASIDAFYSLSMAKGQINNRILGNPRLPGFLVSAIQDYPETGNRFHTVTGAVRYQISRPVFARLEYRYEAYDRSDFQIAGIGPWVAPLDPRAANSMLLGADVPGYHVHSLSVSLEYRF